MVTHFNVVPQQAEIVGSNFTATIFMYALLKRVKMVVHYVKGYKIKGLNQ